MKEGFILKKCILTILLGFVCTFAWGCAAKDNTQQTPFLVSYLNREETGLVGVAADAPTGEVSARIEALTELMTRQPEDAALKAVIGDSFKVIETTLDRDLLTLNVSAGYIELDPAREILIRAALVRTFTQLPEVSYVSIAIEGDSIKDDSGKPIGALSADMFIDNNGNEINSYEKVRLKLYFANQSGTMLAEEIRGVVYSSNISMEKLVVEQLIAGTGEPGHVSVINPETKIVGVTVKDGTCYVNLNEQFLNQPYNVSNEVTMYAISNSLIELQNINKVQISVNGDTSLSYRESIPLSTVFERNLDLIEK